MTISPKTTRIAVCGLGYVGFPLALLFAKSGFKVAGIDLNEEKVKAINKGKSIIEGKEPGLKELAKAVHKKQNFRASTNPEVYKEADVIFVAVETPVEANHEPAYKALKAALKDIGSNMKKGALVIIESTIAPQTMENVVKPTLEAESGLYVNKDFFLAYCPERVRPGRLLENIQNYNRVLGGENKKANQLAKKLYRFIVKAEIEETSPVTAEIVKTGENTYRDVQIAFANELALICEAMGADIWEVRRLINDCKRADRDVKPEDRLQVYFPGAGVGGHCLPKDPWLLIYGAKDTIEPKLIPLARNINDFMPRHTFNLLKEAFEEAKKEIEKSKIVVLGYAYAGNSDDTRNTPSEIVIEKIKKAGGKVLVQDSFVKEYKINLSRALKGAQAIVVMASHDNYKKIRLSTLKKLMRSKPIIIDGRNIFNKAKAQKAGFIYKGIGNV